MTFVSSHYSETDSRPSLTRESTACGTESTLPTPLDEPTLGFHLKTRGRNLTGPRPQVIQLEAARVTGSTIHSSNGLIREGSVDTPSYAAGDSYFALEPRPTGDALRKNTARDLISRYESMSNGRPPTQKSITNPESVDSHALCAPDVPRPLFDTRSKSKSTLRSSFRNFMSIFKKKGKDVKENGSFIGIRYEDSILGHASPILVSPQVLHNKSLLTNPESIEPLKVGPLLYLSQPTSSSALPVWTSCNMSLKSDRIVLEWNTAYGNPCSRTILLEGSNNVRSLAKTEIDATEKSLLPDIHRDAYVFEIIYEKSESERFAINSVAERSAWVSAIWDALLQLGKSMGETGVGPVGESREIAREVNEPDSSDNPDGVSTIASIICKGPLPPPPDDEDEIVLMPTSEGSPIIDEHSSARSMSPSLHLALDELDLTSCCPPRPIYRGDTSRFDRSARVSLARQTSAASRYSDLTEERLVRSSQPGGTRLSVFGRETEETATAEVELEDNHSIYDFYSEGTRIKPLPSVFDTTEMQPVATPTLGPTTSDDKSQKGHTLQEASDLKPLDTELDLISRRTTDSPTITALIQDHAVQQFSQTSDLTGHVISLKNAIDRMCSDLRSVLSEQIPASEIRRVLEDLCSKIDLAKNQQAPGTRNVLLDLPQESLPLEKLSEKLEKNAVLNAEGFSELKAQLDLPVGALSEIGTTIQHVKTSLEELLHRGKAADTSSPAAPLEAVQSEGELSDKLEPGGNDELKKSVKEELGDILSLIRGDSAFKGTLSEQQTENVRYLQELNRWLETFVNSGTSQIQGLAHAVQRLCEDLGCPPEEQGVGEPSDSEKPKTLRAHLSEVVTATKITTDKTLAMQSSLAEVVEATRTNVMERIPIDMESIATMLNRQRQEQESALRAIAMELSNDIRGERLRFVEAMKEATAINVQVHVEEFKKELSREVMMMTSEVGRLQRERQMLEQQISDLFAFFSKQRVEMEMMQRGGAQNIHPPPQQHARTNSRSRPLPTPQS